MKNEFLVETQTSGRMISLALSGELDMLSAPVLEQALDRLAGVDADLVVIDLRTLEFMDSTGLHRLVRAQQEALQAGRRFALIRGTEQVQRVLDLSGVSESLTIVDSPDELLEVDRTPGVP